MGFASFVWLNRHRRIVDTSTIEREGFDCADHGHHEGPANPTVCRWSVTHYVRLESPCASVSLWRPSSCSRPARPLRPTNPTIRPPLRHRAPALGRATLATRESSIPGRVPQRGIRPRALPSLPAVEIHPPAMMKALRISSMSGTGAGPIFPRHSNLAQMAALTTSTVNTASPSAGSRARCCPRNALLHRLACAWKNQRVSILG